MPPLPVSTLFVGLFALLQFPMTIMVGYRRAQTEIPFLDGGSRLLAGRLLHAYRTLAHAWGVPRAFAWSCLPSRCSASAAGRSTGGSSDHA